MRSLPFIKYAPGGNTTILIPHVALTASERAAAAAEMLSDLHLGAEQVGYVKTGGLPRLTMMGGEFCVNAARCLAVFLTVGGLLTPDSRTGWHYGEIGVSGCEAVVPVRARGGNGLYEAAVCLTGEPSISLMEPGMWRVVLPGITHLVLDMALHSLPADVAGRTLQADTLLAQHHLKKEDAAGVIWMDAERIVPVVWVRHTASLCPETACGSGTLAATCVRASQETGQRNWRFVQPSGDALTVALENGTDRPWQAWIGGPVRVVAEGTVRVWCLEDLQTSDV